MDCLSRINAPANACGASCCKTLPFIINRPSKEILEFYKSDKEGMLKFTYPLLTAEMIYYYRVHGCQVNRLPDRSYEVVLKKNNPIKFLNMPDNKLFLLVPNVCPALSSENLCTLHNTDKKPKPCNKLDHGKTDGFLITANCLLIDTEENIKLKESDFTTELSI